jgi:hypothetical protein
LQPVAASAQSAAQASATAARCEAAQSAGAIGPWPDAAGTRTSLQTRLDAVGRQGSAPAPRRAAANVCVWAEIRIGTAA